MISRGGGHNSCHDAHFDIVVCQFGAIGNVFGSKKLRSKLFHQGFAIRDPFYLEAVGEGEGEKDAGMTKPKMDCQFAISLRAKGRGRKARSRSRAFSKYMSVGSDNPAKRTNVSGAATISGKDKFSGDKVIEPEGIKDRQVF